MRGLIVLCFAAFATAAPQGYNYPSQPSGQYLAPSAGAASSDYSGNGGGYNYQQQQPLISKRFFIHSAPEEEEVEVQHRDIVIGTPRKNFNVVFIRSPAGRQQQTKLRILPAANEEKTVVYVLAKKAEEAQIVTHVEEPATTTAKPEVFFIKYKTNEEAEHAQHSIQAEYDRLGGSTIISNEGVPSVSSVIGSLDNVKYGASGATGGASAAGADAAGQASGAAGHGAPSTGYLPPVKKH